jgi:hypothetical protein
VLYGAGQGFVGASGGFEPATERMFSGRLQLGVIPLDRWGGYVAYHRTVDASRDRVQLGSSSATERWVQQELELGALLHAWPADPAERSYGLQLGLGASYASIKSRDPCPLVWKLFPLAHTTTCLETTELGGPSATVEHDHVDARALGLGPSALLYAGLRQGPFLGLRGAGSYFVPWGDNAPSHVVRFDLMLVLGGRLGS